MNNKIDLRFKESQDFINKGIGKPVYKRRAFSFINKILGPQYKWINKSPEEYFHTNLTGLEHKKAELKKAAFILNFTADSSFKNIKANYRNLSKQFHPDTGGHNSAFAILNYAYNIFRGIYETSI